jgi:uncharacterized phage-associated protein
MYDARQIANWFVRRAAKDNRTLSIMQLLKLVYISHGWHLEMRKRPMFRNRIEAWRHGPVIPDVYNAFRGQDIYVKEVPGFPADDIIEYDVDLLDQIYKLYGEFTPFKLSDMTHEPGGPWDIATKTLGYFAPITDDIIQAHYEAKRQKANKVNYVRH